MVLSAFLFDERKSERVDDIPAAFAAVGKRQLLWVALRDASGEEVSAVQAALGLDDASVTRLRGDPGTATIASGRERVYVDMLALAGSGHRASLVSIRCLLGANWILTAHAGEIEVLEEFRSRAEGGGELGTLDALSFLAMLFEWVIASYRRATEDVERELEELDASAMATIPRDAAVMLARLVDHRRVTGALRRALVPHQEVIRSLAHPELDTLSSEESARRYAELETRVSDAVGAVREAKESIGASFEILTARAGQRTNRDHEGAYARHRHPPPCERSRGRHGYEL